MSQRGFVYIVREENTDRCKIGWTTRHPEERVSEIKTSNPGTLTLEGSIAGRKKLERRLHAHFEHKRIRGEWFELDKDEIRDILDRHWRKRAGLEGERPKHPWEAAGVETDEEWELWAEAGFPDTGWDDPPIPD